MSPIVSRGKASPAERLYDQLCTLVGELDIGSRIDLATALDHSAGWDELDEHVRDVFEELARRSGLLK